MNLETWAYATGERKEKKINLEKAGRGASAIIVYYIQLKAGQMQC